MFPQSFYQQCTQIYPISSWLEMPQVELGSIHATAVPIWIGLLTQHQRDKRRGRVWVLCEQIKRVQKYVEAGDFWGYQAQSFENTAAQLSGELENPEVLAKQSQFFELISEDPLPNQVVIITPDQLNELAPTQKLLSQGQWSLKVGEDLNLESLLKQLKDEEFEQVAQVAHRGQFAQRGGILDIYTWHGEDPIRIEIFDDQVESLRTFDIHSQRSTSRVKKMFIRLKDTQKTTTIESYLNPEDLIISVGEESHERARIHLTENEVFDSKKSLMEATASYSKPLGDFDTGDLVLLDAKRKVIREQIEEWLKTGWQVNLIFLNPAECERFKEIMGGDLLEKMTIVYGDFTTGFTIPRVKMVVLSSTELLGRKQQGKSTNIQRKERQHFLNTQTAIDDLKSGEFIVHVEYGIGKFIGIEKEGDDGEEIHMEYKNGAILSVPIQQAHLLARYIGLGGGEPQLTKLGSTNWGSKKKKVEDSIFDYASKLLAIQAERQSFSREPHQPDSEWMQTFEQSCPFTLTSGQAAAVDATKLDMESSQAMDRLICGDVGFGKTEVALRAAFKAVTGGKQVAVLVPTTVLAEQHWQNFSARISEYPITVELLNRFRKPSEIKRVLKGLKNGSVDIVVGTHRLVSNDVIFKNLGLAVIDEEQRFGVKHKEKFKEKLGGVDILTLSATPIPRTLYFSLMGARDMSSIDTPPPNKVPVQTSIFLYHEEIIENAIKREIDRGGQVFFLHNRVKTIGLVRDKIEELVPGVKVDIGHGQMHQHELEAVMRNFVARKSDVLLATTIIESGIDIPNANTIIIDRADRFGLADLYQLRGRVGRGGKQAYAILLLPPALITTNARRRVEAIQQYTALGSGFKIAMRDLEIRGAGNLLGTKQSGHIATIGFDLYCQLLRQAVNELTGAKHKPRMEVIFRADFVYFQEKQRESSAGKIPAYIPQTYLSDSALRIRAYKQLAETAHKKGIRELEESWADQYGKVPEETCNLLLINEIKIAASHARVSHVEVQKQRLMLTRNGDYITLAQKSFPELKEKGATTAKLREVLSMLHQL